MAILAGPETRVIVQGFTGRQSTFYVERARAYGTTMVGGVRPGKGGQCHLGLPVFDTVVEACRETNANASIVFVPAAQAGAALIEAIEAEMPLVVCVTERMPIHDMVRVRAALAGSNTQLVGPNSQGLLVPGVCQIGVMTTNAPRPGPVGVVSRSASLTSEVVAQLNGAGLGQSTVVGIGGDALVGLDFVNCLERFADDAQTQAVVLIGEIGGAGEEAAADWLGSQSTAKPVVALIAGQHAPRGRRMGHAGTMSEIGTRGVADKKSQLASSGAIVVDDVDQIQPAVAAALKTFA